MGNEDGGDFIVEESARYTGNTVLNLHTLVCVACLAGGEVTLKVCDAILVRVDDLTVQGAELRGDDLQEILEHVLRF